MNEGQCKIAAPGSRIDEQKVKNLNQRAANFVVMLRSTNINL